jgi:hypothetical protein
MPEDLVAKSLEAAFKMHASESQEFDDQWRFKDNIGSSLTYLILYPFFKQILFLTWNF